MEEKLTEWAEERISEAKGNWGNASYHQGYKDAMSDLIRHLSNPSFDSINLA